MRKTLWVRGSIVAATAGIVAAVSLSAYGYVFGFDDPVPFAAGQTPSPTHAITGSNSGDTTTTSRASTSTAAPTTTAVPPTTTTHLPMADPATQALPELGGGTIGQGSSGPNVQAYEQRLKDLHLDPGNVDGRFDQNTRYAIETIQKLFGLPRSGRIDTATRFVIAAFKYPQPMVTNGEPDRVEIDLDRQIIVVWTNWKIVLITTTSTGSGRHFCGGDQGCQYANTPTGRYTFTWHATGWKKSKLGQLWNPYYFNGGIAVHGLASVPVYPASHGCARIPMDIATYFATLIHVGEPVYVVRSGVGAVIAPPPTSSTVPSLTTHTTPRSTTTVPPTTQPPTTTTTKPTTTTHPVTTTTHHTTTTT